MTLLRTAGSALIHLESVPTSTVTGDRGSTGGLKGAHCKIRGRERKESVVHLSCKITLHAAAVALADGSGAFVMPGSTFLPGVRPALGTVMCTGS
jgi:hypothetical protein